MGDSWGGISQLSLGFETGGVFCGSDTYFSRDFIVQSVRDRAKGCIQDTTITGTVRINVYERPHEMMHTKMHTEKHYDSGDIFSGKIHLLINKQRAKDFSYYFFS